MNNDYQQQSVGGSHLKAGESITRGSVTVAEARCTGSKVHTQHERKYARKSPALIVCPRVTIGQWLPSNLTTYRSTYARQHYTKYLFCYNLPLLLASLMDQSRQRLLKLGLRPIKTRNCIGHRIRRVCSPMCWTPHRPWEMVDIGVLACGWLCCPLHWHVTCVGVTGGRNSHRDHWLSHCHWRCS